MPSLHKNQTTIARDAARYNVICCGRRFGKDVLEHDRAIRPLMQGQPVAWGAPTYRMLKDNYKALYHILAPLVTTKADSERMEIKTGGMIDFWSLDSPDRIRGRKYARFILNEAALDANLLDTWNMIIRPTLIDLRGGADFCSTPKGLNGYYALWSQAENTPDWKRFKYTTYDNPFIPIDEINALKHAIPERAYRQEIMAEFVEDGGYFNKITEAAVIQQPDTPDNHKGHYLVMGVDWALSEDFTVLTVACRDCNRVVDWDRFNQLDFTYQRERLYTMAGRWKPVILPERNSIGGPNIEIVQQRYQVVRGPDGLPGFNTSATTKPALIQQLAAGLEHSGFLVPLDFAEELRTYQVDTTSTHPKFSAPAGMHDDRVISLALAYWQLAHPQPSPAEMVAFV